MNSKRFALLIVAACILVPAHLALAQGDVQGSKDPSLFTRMPGWRINQYEDIEFAAYDFTGEKGEKISVEGRKLTISYTWAGSGKKPSSLQVIRNYENAIKNIGGTVPYRKGDDFTTMKLEKSGKETWAEINSEVDAGWGGYILTIVEKNAMVQEVTANAEAMSADIKATGHVSVYGINFDTGKSDIKPESDAVLAEIAKLLTLDASLKIYVVGHTDNVGNLAGNLKLSQARAEAVKTALSAKHRIAAGRIGSFGAGPYCPVSSNDTEAGRAKNRRVDLVRQ